LKPEDKEEYISYRLQKADETFRAARELIKGGFWNSCVNRLYYACFYAVNALFVRDGIFVKTHSGAKNQFFQNYIKTGIIDLKFSRLYSDLSDWRQKGDYNDFFDLTEDDVNPMFSQVDEFLRTIRNLIENY